MYSAVQCSAGQCIEVQVSAGQCSVLQLNAMQCTAESSEVDIVGVMVYRQNGANS